MAKITRYNGNLQAFGINAAGTDRTVFNDSVQSDTLDGNITADYLTGWGSMAAGEKPPREWFNAVGYTNSLLSAYLHQSGIAEWNANQEYYEGGICRYGFGVYQSQVDNNVGNTPVGDSGAYWIQIPMAPSAGRNVLVNGGFEVYQLGDTFTGVSSTQYTLDQWLYGPYGTSTSVVDIDRWDMSGGTLPGGGMRSDITTAQPTPAANRWSAFVTRVEGFRIRPLLGQTCTLSFWVYATVPGTYCVSFSNSGTDRSYVAEYTVNNSNTAEHKTITFKMNETGGTWNYNTGIGLRVRFLHSAGSNYSSTKDTWLTGDHVATSNQVNNDASIGNKFAIQQVQLEVGGATTFEYKPRSVDLLECQRYLCPISPPNTGVIGSGYASSTTNAYIHVPTNSFRAITPSIVEDSAVSYSLSLICNGVAATATFQDMVSNSSLSTLRYSAAGLSSNHPVALIKSTASPINLFLESRLS